MSNNSTGKQYPVKSGQGQSTSTSSTPTSTSYTSPSGSYQQSSYVSVKPTKAFKVDGIEFWGSAKFNLDDISLSDKDLIVNCTGTAYSAKPFISKCPDWLELTDVVSEEPAQLVLDWKDFAPPPKSIGIDFWETIFQQAKENGITRIICCCGAGQGRTGTALASLILATGAIEEPEDAIDFIRTAYNERAIENKSQELYIWQLLYSDDEVFAVYEPPTTTTTSTGKKGSVDEDDEEIMKWFNSNLE